MSFAILTNIGRNKEARSLAEGSSLLIVEMAWGDGDGIPSGGESSLQNEQGRRPLTANGVTPDALNTAWFEVFLNEDEGPFVIREVGLFDADGDMVAVARYDPPVNKPLNTVSAVLRINVVFSNLENVVIQIDPSLAYVPSSRVIATGHGLSGGGDLGENRVFEIKAREVLRPRTQKIVLTSDHQPDANAATGAEQVATSEALVQSIIRNHSDADFTFFPGDISDMGQPTAAEIAGNAVPYVSLEDQRRSLDRLPGGWAGFFPINGNHDFSYVLPENDPEEGYSLAEYNRHFPEPVYHIEIGNMVVIFIGDEARGTPGTIFDETVDWWEEIVLANQDRFIVTVTHQSLAGSINADYVNTNKDIIDSDRFISRMTRAVRPAKVNLWLCGHHGSYSTQYLDHRTEIAHNGCRFVQVGAHIPSIAGSVPARPAVYWTMNLEDGSDTVTLDQWDVTEDAKVEGNSINVTSPVPLQLAASPQFDGRTQRHRRFDPVATHSLALAARTAAQTAQQELRLRVIEGAKTAHMENAL